MTLIEVRKGDGSLVGRCDARCYRATNHKCNCICGGKNHGLGYGKAIVEQTKRLSSRLIKDYGKKAVNAQILDNPQMMLF